MIPPPQSNVSNAGLQVDLKSFAYSTDHGNTGILSNVCFDAPLGKITVIMGRSGCGKTTLLRLLAGIQPEPTLRIQYEGEPIHPTNPQIGLVFQDYRLFPWKNVRSNILCAALAAKQDVNMVNELLEEFKLTSLSREWPKTLSGGEQARVALARCLVQRPRVLLLDEVFRSLDLRTRLDIFETVARLTAKYSLVTIAVTHDVDEARRTAEQVVVLTCKPTTVGRIIRRSDDDGHSIHQELSSELINRE